MIELKLIWKLFITLILQTCLLPFKVVSFIFKVIEKVGRVCKETLDHFIKQTVKEVIG